MDSNIPQHVKITTDRRRNTVGVELDYGHDALIRVIWTPDEAMAIGGALTEAADELVRTRESAGERAG